MHVNFFIIFKLLIKLNKYYEKQENNLEPIFFLLGFF